MNASFFQQARVSAVILDMDGVLWRGDEPLPGLAELFQHLRASGLPFVLATNNASKTPEHYVGRLARYGVRLDTDEVLTSSLAAADYLSRDARAGAYVFVVGGDGLRQAMTGAGFALVDRTEHAAAVVVAGIDFDLTYDKLADAAVHIQRGARFVATNTDVSYPAEAGLLPGAGAIVAAIEACTGQTPEVIGKPGRAMFDMAVARLNVGHDRVVMVGDRLDTDILGANKAGLMSVLVTSGVDDVEAVGRTGIEPDAVYSGIDTMVEAWRQAAT